MENEETLVYRLRKRAEIRRNITTRKSVQEDKPDRIADILEEAANEIEELANKLKEAANELEESSNEILLMDQLIGRLDRRLDGYDY
jgi:hypothetical protein